uniref:Uncharacterized protein n=1 Tax=Lepisosteus oculatus TaxID=7918 RepID=W5MSV5_LEPOC
ELAWYRIDIAALSETRFAWKGSICEPREGYRFFWKGKAENEESIHGALIPLPIGVNECLMILCFPLSWSRHLTIISAYAPTLTSCDDQNHRLVRSVLNLHIAPVHCRKPKLIQTKFNTGKLNNPLTREKYQSHLVDALIDHGPLAGDPAEKWNQLKQLVSESAETVLGHKQRVQQDWFDENNKEISKLLAEKHNPFIEWQNDVTCASKRDHFKYLRNKAQKDLRKM